jgi:hypothetical protein
VGPVVKVDITIPPTELAHRFQKVPLTPEQVARLVANAPELARVGPEVSLFEAGDQTYLTRSRGAHEDFIFTSQPVVWSPKEDVKVLVVSGHGKDNSFVAAWRQMEGGFRLESAFIMLSELSPVALAYRKREPDLYWTACWQCPGQGGHVSLREDGRIVIVQD